MTSVKIRHSTALYEEKLIYFLFFFIFQPAAAQWDSQLPSLLTLTFHVCSVSQNHQFHQYVISVNTQHCVQATPTLTCSCSSAPVQCPGGDPAPVLDLNWHYWFSLACHWSSVCAGDSLACCQIVSILLPCLRRVVGVSLCRRHVIAMLLPCRWRVAAVLLPCWTVPLSLMRWGHVTGSCDVAAAAERAYLPFSLSVWIKEQSGTSSLPLIFNTSLIKEAELLKSRSSSCLCDSSSLITRLSLRFKRI